MFMDIERLMKAEYDREYITGMRPVLNRKALFSDTTEDYLSPAQPNPYSHTVVRFRAAINNIDRVFLVHEDTRTLMMKESSDEYFDYFSCEIEIENEEFSYYFVVEVGKISCIYDTRGPVKVPQPMYKFRIIPGFKTPDWAKGAVMYQIYVDRFYNGDPTNDVLTNEYEYIGEKTVRVEDWDKYPAAMGVREFYGGDLQGVIDKMDYLQDLGIDVIYFNPLFVSPSNHKYDIQDYDYIDPHFGKIVSDEGELLSDGQRENRFATRYIDRVTNKANLEASNALFIRLVEEAHRRNIKVILDGVFNHCGSFNKWLDRERIYENQAGYEKGAYVSASSPYRSFFKFNNMHQWPYNPYYDGWWGHDTLPKLNYEKSEELYQYIMDIGKKWVSPPFNADGWRLDVAADLGFSSEYNHKFWKEFRKVVKEANPDALILAEHYGDASSWLRGDEWDTVMNYDAFMEPLTWFFTGMEKHSDEYREDLLGNHDAFIGAMSHHMSKFLAPSLLTSMNELSNHDHSRFLTRTNHKVGRVDRLGHEAAAEGIDKAVMREAIVMQMTWPGAPTLYYGDEAGAVGFTDPDNRRTYPWGQEDVELIEFYRKMIQIHKAYPALIHGSLKFLECQWNSISYARFTPYEQVVVVFNNGNSPLEVSLSVWEVGVQYGSKMQRILLSSREGVTTEPEEYECVKGKIDLTLPAKAAAVLWNREEPISTER